MMTDTRCGYCAILGAPNAGKSTLLNALVGGHVSIVSRKVQTTRCRITGILTEGQTQIVLVDTPGLFDPKRPLDRAMVDQVWMGLSDADIVLLIVDAAAEKSPPDFAVLDRVVDKKRPDQKLLLALNKTDRVHPKEKLLDLAAAYNARYPFADTLMISAEKKDGLEDLKKGVAGHLPASPWFYPKEQIADVPSVFLAAEITREQIFDRLHDELPYQMIVVPETFERQKNGSLRIEQAIVVARDNHKGMVIGKGGQTLKEIGRHARGVLEESFGCTVHLFLRVTVDEKWMTSAERLRAIAPFHS